MSSVDEAVRAARQEDLLRALNLFLDIYGTEEMPPLAKPKATNGLSWFGLCLALVRKQYKPAIDLCRRAIDLQFYNGEHYANLARVYVAAGNRKKAIETADKGLELHPDDDYLKNVRAWLGVRSRPAVPFLDRTNPINVSLGQARHAKKIAEDERRKK
ncbi:MAG TPA: tetratricopeptide repeat protein [Thermoanaerobaculia bacterium]|nr:tetratricopeptide repeat protein [Thermoanaerobaculia bacterium]